MQLVSRRQLCSFLCILLGLTAFGGKAAAEVEEYTYDFSGEMSIWDLSGTQSVDIGYAEISYTLAQDTAGKLTGGGTATGTTWVYGEEYDFVMTYTITGTIKQNRGVAVVKLTFRFKLTAVNTQDPTDKVRGAISAVVMAQVDPGAGVVTGTIKIAGMTEDFESDLDMDGSFTLEVNVDPDGRKLVVDGTVTLDNGDVYGFVGRGNYKAKTDTYSLTLSADTKGEKNRAKLDFNRSEPGTEPVKFDFTILGQKLKKR